MGALPKRRWSTKRQGARRRTKRVQLPTLVRCAHCGKLKHSHRRCEQCGH